MTDERKVTTEDGLAVLLAGGTMEEALAADDAFDLEMEREAARRAERRDLELAVLRAKADRAATAARQAEEERGLRLAWLKAKTALAIQTARRSEVLRKARESASDPQIDSGGSEGLS